MAKRTQFHFTSSAHANERQVADDCTIEEYHAACRYLARSSANLPTRDEERIRYKNK